MNLLKKNNSQKDINLKHLTTSSTNSLPQKINPFNIRILTRDFFSNPLDTTLTVALIFISILGSVNILEWLIYKANWNIVTKNINLFIVGSYPKEYSWRPISWLLIILIISITTLYTNLFKSRRYLIWIIIIPLGIYLHSGGLGLKPLPTDIWGGLSLTLILTLSSGAIAFPLGILLALGKQSEITLVRFVCKIYIEVIRSLPLIAVLFFGQLLIPLFLPMEVEINRVSRAVLAFAIFAASYIAEDIRGGLQAIPKTQCEAAEALGLSKRQIFFQILLPQSIRTALPSLTNQAIGLLQNTSLMAILGLVELLGISRSLLANPEFIGLYLETYVWLAFIYWIICSIMSLLAKKLENELRINQAKE